MQRKNYYLSNIEIGKLEAEAKSLDIAVSDLLRRIIDKHYESHPYILNIPTGSWSDYSGETISGGIGQAVLSGTYYSGISAV